MGNNDWEGFRGFWGPRGCLSLKGRSFSVNVEDSDWGGFWRLLGRSREGLIFSRGVFGPLCT